MALPPKVTDLPPAPTRAQPNNFAATANTFLAALPGFGNQLNTLADWLYAQTGSGADVTTIAKNYARDTGVLPLANIAGSADTVLADLSPALGGIQLSTLSMVEFIPAATNTGPMTLNVNGAGAWPVQRRNGSAVVAGDISAGRSYLLRRRGAAWRASSLLDSDVDDMIGVGRTFVLYQTTPNNRPVPDNADAVLAITSSAYSLWLPAAAPADNLTTDTLVKDSAGKWWRTANSIGVDEANLGRVAYVGGAISPSRMDISAKAVFVLAGHNSSSQVSFWRAISAPANGEETDSLVRDAGGRWWSKMIGGESADSIASAINVAIAAEATARANADAGETAARIAATRDTGVLPLVNVAGGTTITADLSAASGVTTLATTATVELIPSADNSGAVTLNVGGAGAWPVQRRDGSPVAGGDLRSGRSYLLRRRGAAWRVIGLLDSDVQGAVSAEAQALASADAVEASTRAAADTALTLALRDTGILTLANIAGTGDAITADLHPTVIAAGITSLSAASEVEYIPTAFNASANPSITIVGVTYAIRDANGAAWPAGAFVVGRSYKLRRRGTVLRVGGGDATLAEVQTERADRLTGVAQAGTTILESPGGTADAYTATVPATLTATGVSAVNIRRVSFQVVAANTGSVAPTLTIDGVTGAVVIQTSGGALPGAGTLLPGRWYEAIRTGGRWRLVASVGREDVDAAVATEAAARGLLQTELRNRRIWSAPGPTPSGASPPAGTEVIKTAFGVTSEQSWGKTAAPADLLETDTLKKDGSGQWWRVTWDSRTNAAAITALQAAAAQRLAVVASDGAAARNAAAWTTAPIYRAVTAATITNGPPGVASPATASVDVVTHPSGVRQVWRDQSGEVFERVWDGAAWSTWVQQASKSLIDAEATARGALKAEVDAVKLDIAPQKMGRADMAVLAMMGGRAIATADPAGRIRLVLDDWSLADLAARLDLSGSSAAPVSPDLLGGIDGWNVWRSGDLLTFTAQLQGQWPREYVMRAGGQAWINGAAAVPLRLVYGDGLGLAPASHTPTRVAQIATLADGAGQDGLEGATPDGPATGIERAGAGFAALSADLALAGETGLARWVGVRSEAVTGASLTQLAGGQPWANLERAVAQFGAVLAPYGRTAAPDVLTIMHGAGDDSATYEADLLTLCGKIAGLGVRQINVVVPGGTTERGNFASALATVEAFRNRGTRPIRLVAPLYAYPRVGLSQPTPEAVTMLAELDARCAADPAWLPPLAFQAARSGSTIDVDFEVMPGHALVAPDASGLTYSGAAISAVSVIADPVTAQMTRLRVTLATASAGTLTYAQNPNGASVGTIRDDWSAPSVTGSTLYRSALPFRFEVS